MTEETIFAAALTKKTAGERRAFLDEACAGSPQLRAAVEELLKADSDAGSFLDRPPAALDATIVATAASRDTVNSGAWITRLSFLKPTDKPDRIGKLVSQVGEYEIMEVVGHGGMGAVLRAFDTKLSRVVAVKVMAPELAANAAAVKRFLREAQAAAAVHHDHVVTIHAVDESHQPPFLVMQFVEGQTLQDKIDHEGTLELKHILRIGSQAAAGLAAAHKIGLIHRDVKPANILLENGVERVKISDFGLARAADDLQVTQTGIIAGTPQYMSPEQAKGEPIDARSDLFSLGSVLYTMCTGRPAFRADNPVAVLRRVCDDSPRPIRELNAEIPDWLEGIVEKLLSKDPQQRFASAQEVADLLAQCLAHQQQPASCPLPPRVIAKATPAPSGPTEIIKAESRYLWATGIMSVVAAGLMLGTFAKLISSLPSPLAAWLLVGGLISLPVGLVIMYAAWQVESRQSYRWAITAACLSLLPINPFLIFCLPITIWCLVTLQQAQSARLTSVEPKPRKPSPGHLIIEHPVLGLVAILMLLVSVGAATFMLTIALYRLRSVPSQSSLASQMAFVIRATKEELSRPEWLRLSVENPSLAGQLGEPTTKALLTFLADLPDATRRELLDHGYVKWPVSALPPSGQTAIASYESTLQLPDSLPHRTAAALKQAHTGFAVVNLPRKKEKVISWFLIWPQDKHEWVTVVNTKALDNHPSYFAAHHERLSALRSQPDSRPLSSLDAPAVPRAATPPLANTPFDANQAKAHQETWSKYLAVPVEITNSIGMQLRLIPPGKGAARPDGIAQSAGPFFLAATEVTVGQFRRFVEETNHQSTIEKNKLGGVKVRSAKGSNRQPEYIWKHPDFAPTENHPVTLVTWQDAMAFCDWLSKQENCTYRLPTSDEWNWAARAGSAARFYFGDNVSDLDAHAWYLANSEIHSHPVRSKLPNPWGLFDIYGNLWELSYDWERGGKSIDLADIKSDGPPSSERIHYWGGSFNGPPESMTMQAWGPSPIPYSHVGFRVALVGDLKSKAVAAASAPDSAADSAGWTQLFNGKDLTGWKTHPDKPGQWEVKDGVLMGSTQQSFLFSERGDFANYHLRAEVKINGRGDAGIFFRTPFALAYGPQSWMVLPAAGYEAELYNQPAPAGSLWRVNDINDKAPPSLLYRAALESLARANEWFTLELIVNDNHFITRINGKETVNCTELSGKHSTGHFALSVSSPATVVQFRKIEIKELPPDSAAQFPIGSSANMLTSSKWEWSVPENLGPALNSNKADGGPTLSADGLTLIFHSKRDGGLGSEDLWSSTRSSLDAAWPAPQNLGPGINTSYQDHEPCLSADGLSLLFNSNRPGGQGDSDLWLASRSAPGQPWLSPTNLGPLLNSEAADDSPALSADGRTLVFHSNRPGKLGSGDLWISTRRSGSEAWPAPQNLGTDVNSPAFQGFAALAGDSLSLIFNSTRDGSPWSGPSWLSVRKSPADSWSPPQRLFPHDTRGAWSLCLSADHSTVLFDSKRPGGQGDFDIWQVRRVRKSAAE